MKRRRGRAKSLPDSTRHREASYSPNPGGRRSAKRSLAADASRHMSTRRAASKAATNSTNGSIGSADSRRSSLDDATHLVGGVDIDSRRPTKRARRTSTTTVITRRQRTDSDERFESPENTISRKSVAPDLPRIEEPDDAHPADGPITNGLYDGFASEVDEKLSPLPKRRGRKPKAKPITATASRTQALVAAWEQENGTDHEPSNAPSRATSRAPSRPPSRVAKRMPGRRRAPHADPSIEADLRRQLQLRLGYRSVAKALKPLLAELSQRSIDALEYDEEAHQDGDEYVAVMAELDARLQSRLEVLENERRIKMDYRREHLQLQKEELRLRFINRVDVLQDDYQVRAENRLLELYRDFEHDMDADATDEEDGVVVGPQHGRPSRRNPTGQLDHRYDSRSRFFMQTEKLADSRQRRIEMRNQKSKASEYDEDEDDLYEDETIPGEEEYPAGFGTIDATRREYAISMLNLHALAKALQTVEEQVKTKERKAPAVSNEAAKGLQALAAAMDLQHATMLPAKIHTPPVVVKEELVPVAFSGQYHQNLMELTTPPRQVESKQQVHQSAEQINFIDLTSPYRTIKVEENADNQAKMSPTKKKHQRNQSQLSSGLSTRMQQPAVAAPLKVHIPGLGNPPKMLQYSPRMQQVPIPNWEPERSQVAQNGDNPNSATLLHESSPHTDRVQPDVRSAQPPAAETTHSDHASRGTPPLPTTSDSRPTSRWLSLYEQTNQASNRKDLDNARRHEPPTDFNSSRRLSETARPTEDRHSNATQANTSAHRRNISIPARVSSPVAFLRRSQSPLVPESGRRGTLGHASPLTTDLPATYRSGSPSGSQSAIEPLQRRRSDHPPPGSWHGGQHRHSQSSSARTFTPPPPPPHRRATPGPYPSASAAPYTTQPPYTTGPPYHPLPSQPVAPYSGPYQRPAPSAPQPGPYQGPPHHFPPPPPSSGPPYDQRPTNTNPFLPPHPSYSGPPYQPPGPPQNYYYDAGGRPPPPPTQGPFGPRFGQYPPPPGAHPQPPHQSPPSQSGPPSYSGPQQTPDGLPSRGFVASPRTTESYEPVALPGATRTEDRRYQAESESGHGRSESWSENKGQR